MDPTDPGKGPGTDGCLRPVDRRQALRIVAVTGALAVAGGGLARGLLRRSRLERVSESRTRMGTVVTITVVHPDGPEARSMISSAFSELERLERILSRHDPASPLSKLNASGVLESAPVELVEVLEAARRYAERSGGAFDVTVLPLLELFGRSFSAGGRPPDPGAIEDTLELVDYRGIRVRNGGVELADPRMSVTLDGIAKGYIVDRTTEMLVRAGADRVLVNAGGDMSSAGAGSVRDPWLVSVQDPADPHGFVELIRLAGESIATSGDYMRTFSDDRQHHHVIDPRTGTSPPGSSSVSVIASTAMDADAMSTTAMVLGPEEGLALLDSVEGVEGVIVTKNGRQLRTRRLDRHLIPR